MINVHTSRGAGNRFANPILLAALSIAAVTLASQFALAQQGAPPAAQPEGDSAGVPDSSKWTVEQAVVNIRDSDKGVRLAALRRLAKVPGANIQKWIAESAQYDPEARIRYEAVMILGKRKESASLPILMHIAETDKDDRVRTAARAAIGAKSQPQPGPEAQPGAQPTQPGAQPAQPGAQPTQPGAQPAQPGAQPAQPPPKEEKLYDEEGNELPPGYTEARLLDRQKESDEWMKTGQYSADEEEIVDVVEEPRIHSGFLPTVGYDGVIGTPRNTLARSRAGLTIALARGTFERNFESSVWAGDEVSGRNTFVRTDFALLLGGSYAPLEFLEVGLDVEVLTVEKLDHTHKWLDASEDNIDPDDMTNPERLFQDSGYSGAAFGFLSLSAKGLVLRTDLIRAGLVFRATFPTHTGEQLGTGIGAADLYLATDSSETGIEWVNKFETRNGTFWAFEPGAVVSVAPIDSLTVYADFTYMVTLLSYQTHRETVEIEGTEQMQRTYTEDLKATNGFLMTHVGVQYRFLEESLGLQLALQPLIHLHGDGVGGLAGFGIVPGLFYRIADLIETSLTLSIEAGENAPRPLVCTDLAPNDDTDPVSCGTGRRFGFALQAAYSF